MPTMVKIRLKILCAERGISMRTISIQTGITQKTLSLLANGRVSGIKYATLIRIKDLLDCSFDELFEFIES